MYNKPGEDVTVMSQTVEKFYHTKQKGMPPTEAVLADQSSSGSKATPRVTLGRKSHLPIAMSRSGFSSDPYITNGKSLF